MHYLPAMLSYMGDDYLFRVGFARMLRGNETYRIVDVCKEVVKMMVEFKLHQ